MSFSIILQTNKTEMNALDKSITNITTVTGTLKAGTSITNPIIIIAGDLSNVTGCNYMTISEFGRKYFVTDIISIKDNLFEVHGKCDVLTSFKTEIRSNRAIIRRQMNAFNAYLNDGSFRVYQNPSVVTKSFPAGFSTQEFVLAVAGS